MNQEPDTDPIENEIKRTGGEVPPEIDAIAHRHLAALRERMAAPPRPSLLETLRAHWGRTLAYAIPAAAVILLVVVFMGGLGRGGSAGAAYAAMAQQIKLARTLMFTQTTKMPPEMAKLIPGMTEMKIDIKYLEPGLTRMEAGQGIIVIQDLNGKRMLVLDSIHKTAIDQTLTNVPTGQVQTQAAYLERLRSLPERANKSLGNKVLGPRVVQGFSVEEDAGPTRLAMDVWLDFNNRDLVEVDVRGIDHPEIQASMTNFRFNAPVDPALFKMDVPAGYTRQTMNADAGAPAEKDLIGLLRNWTDQLSGGEFPAALDSKAMIEDSVKFAGRAAALKSAKPQSQTESYANSLIATKGLMFVMMMKPENDWHYAGAGAKRGDAKTPIAWWKPTGAQEYRIVFGDLSVRDIAAEDVAFPTPKPSPAK